ncbi:MAG: metal ABC transporter permease [Planctomycetota bacterium]
MTFLLWTFGIAILTAIACALVGVMLVVKREAFISEGLSHSVLPGIILTFLVFRDRSSPLLIISAGLSGLLMVWLVQLIVRTGRVKKDAALGIVFSGMFSIGIIASSLKLKNVHFHAHCIIDGNLAFAPIDHLQIGGYDFGPKAFVSMLFCVLGLVGFITLLYKELKLMAFDECAAHLSGFRPKLLHTIWLTFVSVIAVAAFETAGTILVVAMMIAPPAAANLLTKRLSVMFFVSAVLASLAAVLGVGLSQLLEISPAGPIASISGLIFVLIICCAPKSGLYSQWSTRRSRKQVILEQLLLRLDTTAKEKAKHVI